ncbi:hypothetical protein AMTRI_Chr03g147600 [Amborella trichopoda]
MSRKTFGQPRLKEKEMNRPDLHLRKLRILIEQEATQQKIIKIFHQTSPKPPTLPSSIDQELTGHKRQMWGKKEHRHGFFKFLSPFSPLLAMKPLKPTNWITGF